MRRNKKKYRKCLERKMRDVCTRQNVLALWRICRGEVLIYPRGARRGEQQPFCTVAMEMRRWPITGGWWRLGVRTAEERGEMNSN